MFRFITSLLIITALVGCTAGNVAMHPNSVKIQVGNNTPGDGFVMLGPITAKHGGGCGLFGSQGNYEGAMNDLRNKAAERGANYVQIIRQEGEHMVGQCLDRAYVIDGFAFKKSL